MRKLIQCVQNDNMNVSVKDTIYAIHNAGFDGVFLQWYNKDWEFSQEEQLKLCKSLGLTIEFCHLSYKGINNIWLKGIEGDRCAFRPAANGRTVEIHNPFLRKLQVAEP